MATPIRRHRQSDLGLFDLGRAFARLRARWARQGRRVRQLATKADTVAKLHGSGSWRGSKRQRALLETARQEVGYHAAWARWSNTYDELAVLAAQIGQHPASIVADLEVKFDALMWLLLDDSAVVDRQAVRQIRMFRRALAGLVSAAR